MVSNYIAVWKYTIHFVFTTGAVHKDDCKLDDRIPKWMIVCGSVALAFNVFRIAKSCIRLCVCSGNGEDNSENKSQLIVKFCNKLIEGLIGLFLFIWMIIGSVWVLGKYGDWNDLHRPDCDGLTPADGDLYDKCCHEGTFLFAYAYIICVWSVTLLSLCFLCSGIIVYLIFIYSKKY